MNWSSATWPSREALGLVVEVVELPLEDLDHVARDVLVDLRALKGPATRWSS